jgi:peptide/nickel transport system substrate-binding protein/oligopeptide transport system substrate-binding protein
MKRYLLPFVALTMVLLGLGILIERPAATAQKIDRGTFRSYLTSEPSNLDPARGVDVNEGNVQAKMFDALVQYDSAMNLVGALAESWEVQDDGKTYLFRLRPGVLFHNGQPLTAKDVVFSLDRLLEPAVKSPRTWVLEKVVGARDRLEGKSQAVAGIVAQDEMTVKISLSESFSPFLSLLSMPAAYILPEGCAREIAAKTFFEKPYGTGPFKMVSRERDSFILLAANEQYYGKTPMVSEIEFRIIPESMKAEMEFESGNIDILQLFPSNYDRFKAKSECAPNIRDIPAMNVFYVGFNNQKPPFNDPRVRRALNMMVNRQAIIKAVFKGRGVAAKGSIPPGILGYSETLDGYSYDPEKGLALLKEAGYDQKHPLEFELFQKSSQASLEITRLIQGDLKRHGVRVTLRPMEWSALKDAIDKGEALAFYLSWYGDYPDGENFLYPLFHSKNWGSGGNRARFKSDSVDAMLNQALKIQDPKKRAEAYHEVNRLVVGEAPWLYLWHCQESYVLGANVEALEFSPLFLVDKGLTTKMRQ